MQCFTLATTQSIPTAGSALQGVAAGDVICTQGYYAVGDGGAAKFVVQSGTRSGYFEHTVTTGLKAVLWIRFSPNKTYGMARVTTASGNEVYESPISISNRSDLIIDGCGATVQTVYDSEHNGVLIHVESGTGTVENITIRNLCIRGLTYDTDNQQYNQIVYFKNTHHILLENLQLENGRYALRINGATNHLRIRRLHAEKVFTGMQLSEVNYGYMQDSYVSTDWNALPETPSTTFLYAFRNHCIYAAGKMKSFKFSRLTLLNAGGGNAINRNDPDPPYGVSENLIFSDITIDNCRKAIALGHRTHNSIVRNVVATNVHKHGMDLNGIQNISVVNCHFSGGSENTDDAGFLIPNDSNESGTNTDQYSYVKHIWFRNCSFSFHRSFFAIEEKRYKNCNGLKFWNCSFTVSNPLHDRKKNPAYIKGIINDVRFISCQFKASGFTTENHSKKGVFFYFDSKALDYIVPSAQIPFSSVEMHWHFEKCAFINNGSVSVNSPILSSSENDSYQMVYCSLNKCTLKGFRWTIRIAVYDDESNVIGNVTVNPCCIGWNTAANRTLAKNALHNRQRFLSHNNYYLDFVEENGVETMQAIPAEEYGYT